MTMNTVGSHHRGTAAHHHPSVMTNARQRVRRARQEKVALSDYDPQWPRRFEREARHLRAIVPPGMLGRIAHFGSTAVPGMVAKPIIDMLIEVPSLQRVHDTIAPILERHGYEYFWRPSWRDNLTPEYTWFIKRDAQGTRTHHLHMLPQHAPEWGRLLFRDYLRAHPQVAQAYAALKRELVHTDPDDRIAYARAKSHFIAEVMHAVDSGFRNRPDSR
jgi:GrpB-like predicted nucleotidyltransferase (UPF0157 family)